MDKVQKIAFTDYNAPSSEPFRLHSCFNFLGFLRIIHFTAVMYLNQFRAVKCFLEKTAVMGNVIGVPQNMECVFRVSSVEKKIENHSHR
jgi:hypothetical protein